MENPIQTDILCVGAGVASLAAAIRSLRTLKARGVKELPKVMVIDKGRSVGSHVLSGLVFDTACLKGFLTDEEIDGLTSEKNRNRPFAATVTKEAFHVLLDAKHSLPVPWVPPMMRDKGYPVGSLTKLTQPFSALPSAAGFAYTVFLPLRHTATRTASSAPFDADSTLLVATYDRSSFPAFLK